MMLDSDLFDGFKSKSEYWCIWMESFFDPVFIVKLYKVSLEVPKLPRQEEVANISKKS